jgi:hypothetical protein
MLNKVKKNQLHKAQCECTFVLYITSCSLTYKNTVEKKEFQLKIKVYLLFIELFFFFKKNS